MPGGPLLSEFHRGDATEGALSPNRKPAASDKLHTPAEVSEADPPDRAAGKVRSWADPIEKLPISLQ